MNEFTKFGRENVTLTNKATTVIELYESVASALWHSTNIDKTQLTLKRWAVCSTKQTHLPICAPAEFSQTMDDAAGLASTSHVNVTSSSLITINGLCSPKLIKGLSAT